MRKMLRLHTTQSQFTATHSETFSFFTFLDLLCVSPSLSYPLFFSCHPILPPSVLSAIHFSVLFLSVPLSTSFFLEFSSSFHLCQEPVGPPPPRRPRGRPRGSKNKQVTPKVHTHPNYTHPNCCPAGAGDLGLSEPVFK